MMRKVISLVLAYFFIALAVIGVFLPGIPTVPFLLLSAWFAARGSDRLHKWLYAHPTFGSLLINWEQQKAISRKSKILAVLMLCGSWIFLYHYLESIWLLLAISGIFLLVATFILTRREPY
ncbi:YbaN family protein [Microbulbifer agarilyticus]|uniref:YbaN family protein n=1 Tax=Microbulbifer agarilyticus TaxID=260552 RepID=UPI001CD1B833|nr:YbaN family protein [Microbulbifer agarilyticus]MCA0901126.1 YbaN family protein [Microbulbifer agarilyticus]